MSLISTHNLGKSYGPVDIFSGLSFNIPHGARIALVGPNGIGKTTLLRIIAGQESHSTGSINRARDLTLGYLPQESVLESQRTLWGATLLPFAGLQALETELTLLEARMTTEPHNHAALERYGVLQERFEHQGGYTYENRVQQVLAGLGFSKDEYPMPLVHPGVARLGILVAAGQHPHRGHLLIPEHHWPDGWSPDLQYGYIFLLIS